jgi:hypothetical protein
MRNAGKSKVHKGESQKRDAGKSKVHKGESRKQNALLLSCHSRGGGNPGFGCVKLAI